MPKRAARTRAWIATTAATVIGLVGVASTPSGAGAPGEKAPAASAAPSGETDEQTLKRYAADTWHSMEALAHPDTGLPASVIDGDLAEHSEWTGPTPFGSYLWSATAAYEIGLIDRRTAVDRVRRTLSALAELDRHEPSGMFYRWYDPATGELLEEFPDSGDELFPFASSVDNGWAAAGLMVVREAFPELRRQIDPLLRPMDFGWFYDETARGDDVPAGLLRNGFYAVEPTDDTCFERGDYDGVEVYYTCGTYNTLGETRIASYVGIGRGQLPPEHYFAAYRGFPDTCEFDYQEQQPVGEWQTYLGVPVWEGAYEYRGMRLMPNWNGSMFEALMPNLLVPEEEWGPRSWGVNHPLWVQAQKEHGLDEAEYGYWGFSPSNDPFGGYGIYGVDAIGMNPDGATSDREETLVDHGFEDCGREPQPEPDEWGDGIVTPHASFLALRYDSDAVLENLRGLEEELDAYGAGGFYDAVAVRSGTIARDHLSLDQGMVMAALGNELADDALRDHFVGFGGRAVARSLAPLIEMEEFAAQPRDDEVDGG